MKNKGFKVYTISGFTGLMLLFLVICTSLIVFVILPTYIIKELWNYIIGYYFGGPVIWYLHSFLLWAATILIAYTILKNYVSFAFQAVDGSEDPDTENFLNEMSKKESITEEEEHKLETILKDLKNK